MAEYFPLILKDGKLQDLGIGDTYAPPNLGMLGQRGIYGGGYDNSVHNIIDYIVMSTTGNATDFGDLTLARHSLEAASSGSRGISWAGWDPVSSAYVNVADYITIATTGNATDFGDISTTSSYITKAPASSTVRALFAGGTYSFDYEPYYDYTTHIGYFTFATTGNSSTFGQLTYYRGYLAGCSNNTRGLFAGGFHYYYPDTTEFNIMEYVTIATTGNATDFGDLTNGTMSKATGASSFSRAIIALSTTLNYVSFATTSNASNFGSLSTGVNSRGGSTSNNIIATFSGSQSPYYNNIQYVTIETTGNSSDFGDLTYSRGLQSGCSGN